MFLIRDILFCKPGKVRPLVEKFQAMNKLGKRVGLGPMRLMTDISAERYWMLVSEVEVKSIEEYEEVNQKMMADPKFQEVMKGYHDLVEGGRREIYAIEK